MENHRSMTGVQSVVFPHKSLLFQMSVKKKIPLEGYKPENLHVSLFVDKNTKEKSTSISIFQKKVKGLVCLAERYTK